LSPPTPFRLLVYFEISDWIRIYHNFTHNAYYRDYHCRLGRPLRYHFSSRLAIFDFIARWMTTRAPHTAHYGPVAHHVFWPPPETATAISYWRLRARGHRRMTQTYWCWRSREIEIITIIDIDMHNYLYWFVLSEVDEWSDRRYRPGHSESSAI
jgi:hypothetical protein